MKFRPPNVTRLVPPRILLVALVVSVMGPQTSASYAPPLSAKTQPHSIEDAYTRNSVDPAGNPYATGQVLTFTPSGMPPWRLPLTEGWNLISVPAMPEDGRIDNLFGTTREIDAILTYEEGEAKVAVRDPATGLFAGSLEQHHIANAYWIWSSAPTTVEVDFTLHPPLPLYVLARSGVWTLVPVLSIDRQLDIPAGTKIDPGEYLGPFLTAYGWTGNDWVTIDPDHLDDPDRLTDEDPALEIGKGYWVYYAEDVIIVPHY